MDVKGYSIYHKHLLCQRYFYFDVKLYDWKYYSDRCILGGVVMQATLLDFGCIIEPYRVVYPRPYLWENGVKKTIQKKLSDFGMGIKTRSL